MSENNTGETNEISQGTDLAIDKARLEGILSKQVDLENLLDELLKRVGVTVSFSFNDNINLTDEAYKTRKTLEEISTSVVYFRRVLAQVEEQVGQVVTVVKDLQDESKELQNESRQGDKELAQMIAGFTENLETQINNITKALQKLDEESREGDIDLAEKLRVINLTLQTTVETVQKLDVKFSKEIGEQAKKNHWNNAVAWVGIFGSIASMIGTFIAFNPQSLANFNGQTDKINSVEPEVSLQNQALRNELRKIYKEKMILKLEEYGLTSKNENYTQIVDDLNTCINNYVDAKNLENKKINLILLENRLLKVFDPEVVKDILDAVFLNKSAYHFSTKS